MNPDTPKTPREEMETWLTSLLLGELSAGEAAAVRELIKHDPALAKLHDDLKSTIQLVREVSVQAAEPAPAVLEQPRLSENRRQQLLTAFLIPPLNKENVKSKERARIRVLPVLVVLAIIALLASVAMPHLVKSRHTAQANSVINNLRQLDGAKQQWAIENNKPTGAAPTFGDLKPYLSRGDMPAVAGENFVIGRVGEPASAKPEAEDQQLAFRTWSIAPSVVAPSREIPQPSVNYSSSFSRTQPTPTASGAPSTPAPFPQIVLPTTEVAVAGSAQPLNLGQEYASVPAFESSKGLPIAPRGSVSGTIGSDESFRRRYAAPANSPAIPRVAVAGGGGGGGGGAGQAVESFSHAGGPVNEGRAIVAGNRLGGEFAGGQLAVAGKSEDANRGQTPTAAVPGTLNSVSVAETANSRLSLGLDLQTSQAAAVGDEVALGQTLSTNSLPATSTGAAKPDSATAYLWAGAESLERSKENGRLGQLKDLTRSDSKPTISALSVESDLREATVGLKVAEEKLTALQKDSAVAATDFEQAQEQVTDLMRKAAAAHYYMDLEKERRFRLSSQRQESTNRGAMLKASQAWETPTTAVTTDVTTDLSNRKPSTNALIPQPEVQTRENNLSTFSLNVSDVSFKLAQASLEKGQMPDTASIRSEEFINAFDYHDPEPQWNSASSRSGQVGRMPAPLAFAWERARYPFAHNRDLLRFSIKTAAAGRQTGRALNLVLLLDNSGSMERADRVRIIREALKVLAAQLQPQDKLSVITFARTARLVADGISGDQAGAVTEAVSGLTPEGGTNLEEAMNLGYQTAARHYLISGINRVVLLTDGAANLGDVEPASLKAKVEAARKQGIALDCFGIGWDGFNDDLLEVLSRNGDGRYGFINSPEEATTDFVSQLAGALQVAASDVKVQVEFNPQRVTSYRQIGYAKHQLTKEQFRDNTVDAAEIAAQEAGNALYTVEVNPAGSGPLGTVRVRYKIPGTSDYHEQAWDVPYTGNALALEQASPAMRLAASASAFSEWLVASPFAGEVSPDALLHQLRGVPEVFGADSRPKTLEWMIRQAKSIEGK